jgi:hypothetical protein
MSGCSFQDYDQPTGHGTCLQGSEILALGLASIQEHKHGWPLELLRGFKLQLTEEKHAQNPIIRELGQILFRDVEPSKTR